MRIKSNIILSNNKNFRKKDIHTNRYFELVEKEHLLFKKKFGNSQKIITSKKFIRTNNCCVCKSKKYKSFVIKFGFQYVKCSSCGHIYLRNQIKNEILLDLYSNSKTDKVSRERKKFSELQLYWQKIYFKYSNILFSLCPKGKLLDIGCGDGAFLEFMKINFNYELYGTEYSKDTKKKLKKLLGKNFFYRKEIEDLKIKKNFFNLVSLIGVLEHLSDPNKLFKTLSRYVKKKGFIFILIPNLDSYSFSVLKEKTPTLNPRAHLNFFTRKSLGKLIKRFNFKITHKYQELPVIDLVHKKKKINDKIIEKIIKNDKCYYHIYLLQKNK